MSSILIRTYCFNVEKDIVIPSHIFLPKNRFIFNRDSDLYNILYNLLKIYEIH